MSESDDKQDLSGLARSIDALFVGDASGAGASSEEPAAVPLDSLTPSESPEADAELLAVDGPPGLPAGDRGTEALTGEFATSWTQDEPHTEAGPAQDASRGPDPDAFARAVDALLAGEPGAAAEVEELARELGERLALDPLADAAERLAHAAGDPPDPTLLDVAVVITDRAVASRIVQRIGHERDDARKAEYATLCRRLGEIMAKAFRGALTDTTDKDVRRTYRAMLIAMGPTSRPIIEEMIDDENGLLACSAVAILGEVGGGRALELVTSALANPDARVRREALLALAKLGDEETGTLLLGSLEDADPEVRLAAATAAGELKVDRALRTLLAMLDAEADPDRLRPLIRALGQLGDPGAVPAIEKHAVRTMFSKPPAEVRVEAYRALHRIGTPHARDLVQQALSDKEAGVRAAVHRIVASAGPPKLK